MKYNKIVILSADDTMWGPMTEAMLSYYLQEEDIQVISRGLVVLFPEPVNPKIVEMLEKHQIRLKQRQSEKLQEDELDENTLVLTMQFSQKVQVIEDFHFENHVYTVSEYAGEEADLLGPYGGGKEEFESFYQELESLLPKVVERLKAEE